LVSDWMIGQAPDAVAVGEALQRRQLLRRGLGGDGLGLRLVGGDVVLGRRVLLRDLSGELGVVGAGQRQGGVGGVRIALGRVGLSAGRFQPRFQRPDQLGLAVVGDLAFADQRDLVLGLQSLHQDLAVGLDRGDGHRQRRGRDARRQNGQRRQQRQPLGAGHARQLLLTSARNAGVTMASLAAARLAVKLDRGGKMAEPKDATAATRAANAGAARRLAARGRADFERARRGFIDTLPGRPRRGGRPRRLGPIAVRLRAGAAIVRTRSIPASGARRG
jgi:hypothetical protein